ncbi:MAG TPA: DUF2461 domain-containing protein [Candidatus Dormibacteraeota bacterium]
MPFEGWPGDFVGFFRGLEIDNSKRYFDAHRSVFMSDVRGPIEALCAELEPRYGPVKIFRINRDIRFSADKSPYKTNVAATIGDFYVSLDARELYLGTGFYHPSPEWLGRYRAAVAGPAGERLAAAVERMRAEGVEVGGPDQLRGAPKGYSAEHPRIDLLRLKNVVAMRHYEVGPWIASREALERIVSGFEGVRPLREWLREHVPGD